MSRELDVKVAKALGCKVMQSAYMIGGRQVHYPACTCPNEDHADQHSYGLRAVKEYSTDIAAAFPLFEWLAARGIVRLSNGDGDSMGCDFFPTASIWPGADELKVAHVTADTWCGVICKAFLAANGVECPAP